MGLSMAYNYWEKGTELMDPQVHHLFADDLTSGRTVAELPILYYTVAQLWRITGPNAFVYRLFMLLLHFAGSYALFLTFRRFLADSGWAVLASLFFFTSPAIVYFAIGFMPDVPAYDLVLLGFYALVRRWPEERKDDMVFSAVLFALAALLKIAALMVPHAFWCWGRSRSLYRNVFAKAGGFFRNRRLLIGLLLGVLVLVFTWYAWSDVQ
ncbi:MAG: glycosyltransferase family 39 protein [Flavobacteriales bacterium]